MSHNPDVLVVGAGPVGLMLACELQRHRVRNRIIDKLAEHKPFSKALGFTPRMLEIWEHMGLADEAVSRGLFFKGFQNAVNGEVVLKVELAGVEMPYGALSLPQYESERILLEHLERLGGEVERGVELVSLAQDPDGVTATLAHADGATETVRSRYLAGCDGAHSVVRHGLGMRFEGDQYAQTFMLGDVDLDWELEHGYSYRFLHVVDGKPGNALVCVPIRGRGRYRISMIAPPAFYEEPADSQGEHGLLLGHPGPTLEQLQEMAKRLGPKGTKVENLRWSSFYRISHRIVDRYREGRAFVAGDAAHIHPPIGGQGMNTGMQDAYNLGWKLGLVVNGAASEKLLDSYNAERLPVGQDIVTRTTTRMEDHAKGKPERSMDAMAKDSQLFVNYRESPWVGEDVAGGALAGGPCPGDRAPDAYGLKRPFVDHPYRVFEFLRAPQHTLFIYLDAASGAPDYGACAEIVEALEAKFGSGITAYAILAPGAAVPNRERIPLVFDAGNGFHKAYDAAGGSAYLIRPDGYVGYRAHPLRRDALERYLSSFLT